MPFPIKGVKITVFTNKTSQGLKILVFIDAKHRKVITFALLITLFIVSITKIVFKALICELNMLLHDDKE